MTKMSYSRLLSYQEEVETPTCGVDVKVGGFVGDVPQGFEARSFGRDLGGVSQGLVHIHLKRTLWDLLAGKQHGHLSKDPTTRTSVTSTIFRGQAARGTHVQIRL